MRMLRAAAVAIAAIGIAAPAAQAQFVPPVGGIAPGVVSAPAGSPCTVTQVPAGVGTGNPGTAPTQLCQGTGLIFVGPMIGQIASVIGPTTIGPAVVGPTVVSAGSGAAGF